MSQAAMVHRPNGQTAISGTFSDTNEVTAMLERRGADFHLVSPTTECSVIPEGCSVSFAAVLVDLNDTYPQEGGKMALHRVALDKIAAAAGISWDSRASGRIDNGSDPHYCMYRAVGYVRQFDGTIMQLPPGTKEMDLRDGSQVALDCIAKDKLGDLRMQRKHIVSHAETKARLRAIASLGIRRSYTKEELRRPFVCARLSFTGETSDPELRRAFALKRADAFLGSAQSAYGPPLLPDAEPRAMGIAPPPVGSTTDDDGDSVSPPRASAVGGPIAAPPAPARAAAPPPAPPPTASAVTPQAHRPQGARSGHIIPGGKMRGQAIEEASDTSLNYWSERIAKALDEGTARRGDEALHQALCKEIETRAATSGGWDKDSGDDDKIPF